MRVKILEWMVDREWYLTRPKLFFFWVRVIVRTAQWPENMPPRW